MLSLTGLIFTPREGAGGTPRHCRGRGGGRGSGRRCFRSHSPQWCLSLSASASVAGRALQSLEAEMAAATAADNTSAAGENLGTFSVPENQHLDPEGSCGPDIELGRVRPMTRSQREVGQSPKGCNGGSGGSGPPAQTKSNRKRKPPKQNLTTQSAGGPQLPEALELPRTPQPPPSLSSQPSSSHHFGLSVGNLESPGPTLRSTAKAGYVSTPAPKALSQATRAVSGLHSSVPESSSAGSSHSIPAGPELSQQATLQVPGVGSDSTGSGTPEGWVLRSRVVTFGHQSSAPEVSREVHPEAHHSGWNLRPRATPRVPVVHTTLRSSPDRSSRATQSRSRSRSAPRFDSDHQRKQKLSMELEVEPQLESEEEPEPDPELGPSSGPQASLSTFRPAIPRRSSLAPAGSPPRRPVRMRASSPSPPGRLYPFPVQYNEDTSSSSSSPSEVSFFPQ